MAVADLRKRYYPRARQDVLDRTFCRYASAGMTVLDAGCGNARGCSRDAPWQQMYVVGIDCHASVKDNPFCDAKLVGDLSDLPFADASFDLIHCRWVFEHLAHPLLAFKEFSRTLKPGGRLLALTPNLFHYATFGAWLTPQWFHQLWWRGEYDAFPVRYRANCPATLRRLAEKAGFRVEHLTLIEGPPHYLTGHRAAYLAGVLYERFVNASPHLAWLRQRILLDAVLSNGHLIRERARPDGVSRSRTMCR